jgi:hypothetical protein
MKVTDEMVTRFLSWNLPQDFEPDCYILFSPVTARDHRCWPSGTNLLNAEQAKVMLEHVLYNTLHTANNEPEILRALSLIDKLRVENKKQKGVIDFQQAFVDSINQQLHKVENMPSLPTDTDYLKVELASAKQEIEDLGLQP